MWLPWQTAFWAAVVLSMLLVAVRRAQRVPKVLVITAKEVVVVLFLYTLWQYVRELAITKVAGAIEHAHSLWRLERTLHIGTELWLQKALIDHRLTMQFLNIYYGGLHVPMMGAVLIWMFVRHREQYATVRTTLALLIAGCITIQALVPMAPPRFLTDLGFVDAGLRYGLSVYGTGGSGVSNELAALPSLHAGWSLLAAYAAVVYGTGKWRWLMVLHPVLTMVSIVATGNHWWLDAVLAALIMMVALLLQRLLRTMLGTFRPAAIAPAVIVPLPDRDRQSAGAGWTAPS